MPPLQPLLCLGAGALVVVMACSGAERSNPSTPSGGNGATSGGMAFAGGGVALAGGGAASSSGAGAGGSSGGGSSGGGSSGGTAGSGAGVAGTSAQSGGTSSDACAEGAGGAFEMQCLACATSDCERCLCSQCENQLVTCASTEGCQEILACIRESGCAGVDCYCGTFNALACSAGQSNGPCKSAILGAPGGHEPSALNPSAGPASDAAIAVGDCAQPGRPCEQACSM